jgi:hypothetical protein
MLSTVSEVARARSTHIYWDHDELGSPGETHA